MVKPTTGAPDAVARRAGRERTWARPTAEYSYNAETTYVAGEFYWPVERGQRPSTATSPAARSLLSMEGSPRERDLVARQQDRQRRRGAAFKLQDKKDLFKRGDAGPTSAAGGRWAAARIILLFVVVLSSCCWSVPAGR